MRTTVMDCKPIGVGNRPLDSRDGRCLVSLRLAAVSLLVLLATTCGGRDVRDSVPHIQTPQYTEDGLRLVVSDTDGDGVPEVYKYFREEVDEGSGEIRRSLVRTEVDLDGDGSINLRRAYDENGLLRLEEMDGNVDGRMDRTVFWENGFILRSELDTDDDGASDEFRYYTDGYLVRVLRDTDGNGAVDMWSYYDDVGLLRVGHDTDGDGNADRWTRRSE